MAPCGEVLGTITIVNPQGTPPTATDIASSSGDASQLLTSYVQEMLHHLMHLRVFVWEQVSGFFQLIVCIELCNSHNNHIILLGTIQGGRREVGDSGSS